VILPIGHEETTVRRTPWITVLVIAACLAVFAVTELRLLDRGPGAPDYLAQAAAHWLAHPYLEADPRVEELALADFPPERRQAAREGLIAYARQALPGSAALRKEQTQLDGLTKLALEQIERGERPDPHAHYKRWGLTPASPRPEHFVTHAFLHAGWAHLLGNLLFFFLVAYAVEDRWGRPLFTSFYLSAAVVSGGVYCAMAGASEIPLVGASGAIAGVMGAFLVRMWSTRIRYFYFFFALRIFAGTFSAPAYVMLPLWFAGELVSAWAMDHAGVSDGVAYWAHVGGFAYGVVFAAGIRAARIEERFIHPAIESEITKHSNPVIEEAMEARLAGDLAAAHAALEAALRGKPDDPDLALAFFDVARESGDTAAAERALTRVLRGLVGRGERELAVRYWVELSELGAPLEPALALRLVPWLLEAGQPAVAASALRGAARAPSLSPGQALRLVDLARDVDAGAALAAACKALEAPDLDETKREKLEALVAELEARESELDGVGAEPEKAVRAEPEEAVPAEPAAALGREVELEVDPEPVHFAEARTVALRVPSDAEATTVALRVPSAPGAGSPFETAGAAELTPDGFDPIVGAVVADEPRFAHAKVVEAQPIAVDEYGIAYQTGEGRRTTLAWSAVQAVGVGAVSGLSAKPVIVIDLATNWLSLESDAALELVRLRSDTFSPRRFAKDAPNPVEALRAILARIFDDCDAVGLPDAESARGYPFRQFADLASYEREVLRISG
jgi:membrane associated rhomboid family serine protease